MAEKSIEIMIPIPHTLTNYDNDISAWSVIISVCSPKCPNKIEPGSHMLTYKTSHYNGTFSCMGSSFTMGNVSLPFDSVLIAGPPDTTQ